MRAVVLKQVHACMRAHFSNLQDVFMLVHKNRPAHVFESMNEALNNSVKH